MKKALERVSKLEAVAGIKPKQNPFFKPTKKLPYTPLDWTADELFNMMMGDESLGEKESKTDWTEWDKDEGENLMRKEFLSKLTTKQLRILIEKIEELSKDDH